MLNDSSIVFTGGSGLLGTALQRVRPSILYPSSRVFDVTDRNQMDSYLDDHACRLIVHAAAFTSPPKIDADPMRAVDVNIIGTANVVALCAARGIRLLYLSTDYVFDGDKGQYREQAPVHPVNNYAWSKLGGECAVRLLEDSLIIRTSFGPDVFPFEKAFVDQWTSRESVSVFAGKLSRLIDSDLVGVIHVGGTRRTVMEYARNLDSTATVGGITTEDVTFAVPRDTSLDCSRYMKEIENALNGGRT